MIVYLEHISSIIVSTLSQTVIKTTKTILQNLRNKISMQPNDEKFFIKIWSKGCMEKKMTLSHDGNMFHKNIHYTHKQSLA